MFADMSRAGVSYPRRSPQKWQKTDKTGITYNKPITALTQNGTERKERSVSVCLDGGKLLCALIDTDSLYQGSSPLPNILLYPKTTDVENKQGVSSTLGSGSRFSSSAERVSHNTSPINSFVSCWKSYIFLKTRNYLYKSSIPSS